MSIETTEKDESMMGTKPQKEHEWLQKLVGEWRTSAEMTMPDGSESTSTGTETVTSLGGLWAYGEGQADMPGGGKMQYRCGIGYDVSFKEYRGFWLADMSSHLWKYAGNLSNGDRTLTLNCEGPDMEKDGETANYRDVHEIVDDNHRTMTSFAEDGEGNWQQFMKVNYTRA